MIHSYLSLGVFLTCYVLFIFLPTRRSLVAVGGALVLAITGVVPLHELPGAINWNVMGIFVGMLVVADVFIESRCPAYLAEIIANRAPNTALALVFICALTSFISAFVENVATLLIIAPIALAMAKRIKLNPVPMMIGIAICSNLQGTATLIGDPPSMLLGGFAKMTFLDFFFYHGKPSIFFAVQLGAVFSLIVLYFVFRRDSTRMSLVAEETVKSWTPTVALVLLIFVLAASSFFDKGFSYLAGAICMVFAVVLLIWARAVHETEIIPSLRRLDWDTTFFLMGIFIIVDSLTLTGWTDRLAESLSGMIGGNIFLGYTIMVLLSVIISGFVDNVPYLAAMLPVAMSMAEKLHMNPTLFLFGLLIGASLGGNITPIGASANVVGCGLLRKEGYVISFGQWAKISIPFTIAAVVPAYLLVWFLWT
jgi:Na+/H+ antiporter NhaD/arsenite permease-like protein